MAKTFFKLRDVLPLYLLGWMVLTVYFAFGDHHLLQFSIPLGFEPEENKYKVLLATDHVQKGYRKHWVTTLGTNKSWREAKIWACPGFGSMECKTAIAAFDVKTLLHYGMQLTGAITS
ncbi:hypothetical protein HAX54_045174 [Datura stramonium]|uniref:F-box associated beta-propeller type 3 domain-containing protein n=1 Tax=Datura stramonium TaxID=4076 RepID=A0ABS8WJH4_DATST|nr:hypothetical protein [Datura stramonium]